MVHIHQARRRLGCCLVCILLHSTIACFTLTIPPPQQASATLNGPIMVFLVPVGEGSAANPPPGLPQFPGLPAGLPGVRPGAGEVPPVGLPELHPPSNGDGE